MNEQIFSSACSVLDPDSDCSGSAGEDARLLDRFIHHGDAEAFACLVRRHGPMVLGVCRQVLHHQQDAEDAAQEAFLLLIRKAASIRSGESVGAWLYTTAYRLALRTWAKSARRLRGHNSLKDLIDEEPGSAPPDRLAWRELCQWLDAALSRIPEKYRSAFVLCQLEGQSGEEAAAHLACPVGTVRSRVGRAKRRLRAELDPPCP